MVVALGHRCDWESDSADAEAAAFEVETRACRHLLLAGASSARNNLQREHSCQQRQAGSAALSAAAGSGGRVRAGGIRGGRHSLPTLGRRLSLKHYCASPTMQQSVIYVDGGLK